MTTQLITEYSRLSALGIDEKRLSLYEVILLPENIFSSKGLSELYDAGEARHLAKLLQLANIRMATIFDFGIDVALLARRSHDQRLGVIWVRDVVILPTLIGILSSLIASQLQKAGETRVEPKVYVDLYLERGPNITKISYKGDGPTLINMLNAIEPKGD